MRIARSRGRRPRAARWACRLAGALASFAAVGAASAHPHVFAEARMEIVGDTAGKLVSVRNIWRMDELFSASVVVDFDKNANGVLDDDELQAVGDTVKESIAEWSFYTFVRAGGALVPMDPPAEIRTLYQDDQLLMFFEMKPKGPVDLTKTPITVSNFDETFFVAFVFEDDASFDLVDMPASCTRQVVVPDEDEAAQQWMASIAAIGPDEKVPESSVDYAQILATRAEIKCG